MHFFGTLNDTLNSTLNVSNDFRTMFKYFNNVPFNVPFKVGFWGTSAELFNLSIYSRFTLRIDKIQESTETVHQDGGDKETKDNNGTNDKNR